jgi:integrase
VLREAELKVMPRITKRLVDSLRPERGRDLFVWDAGDGALKGFGIRIKPSGTGSYLVQYRNKEGRTRRFVLGRLGTLTPDDARRLAGDALRTVAMGGDPSAERQAIRGSITIADLCDLYLADAKGRIKASTLAMDKSRIETHVKPLIGRYTVRSLTTADIERMIADIAAGKTAKPRKKQGRGGLSTGGSGVAARTVGMTATILEYARGSLKLIKDNPARGVKKPPDRRQRRFLTLEEIATLGEVMREEDAEESATALAAIRFLLLTGFRRMEALGLQHKWVDARARCVRFEDTKSGPQLRPIGTDALAVLKEQPVHEGLWTFPAARGAGHFVGLPKVLARICSKAKLEGITTHVLRHTFAATAAEMGFSELTIAGLLGHSVPGVTARYAHVPDAALVAAADRVSARIATALAGKTSSVVRLHRKGANS